MRIGELRSEVESLLKADDANQDGFMKSARPASLAKLLLDGEELGENGPGSGRQIGRYRLHGLIGRGGMSEVYRAELIEPEGQTASNSIPQEVALKLISGPIATDEAVCRFRTEQELLATINHPDIARFLDGRLADDGLPSFVMELIRGRRIDRYCDDKELSPTERVQLFLRVCEAVDFVHRTECCTAT